jgi:hypothetical protein
LRIAPLPSVSRQFFNLPPYAVAHLSLPTTRFLAPYISGTELCLFGNPIADFKHWHRPHWIIFHGVLVLPLVSRTVPLIVSGQDTLCKHFSNFSCGRCLDSSRFVAALPPATDKKPRLKNGIILNYFKPVQSTVRRRTLPHNPPKQPKTRNTPKITEYFYATRVSEVRLHVSFFAVTFVYSPSPFSARETLIHYL